MAPIHSLLAELRSELLHAQSAIEAGKPIDLNNLQSGVSLLCARSLDLPLSVRQQARTELISLQDLTNHLLTTLSGLTAR
jgi:hypothetical protein